MECKIFCQAYAKINLHLAVGLPDESGYHTIESIFSKVGLYDSLEVSYSESPFFSIEVRGLEQYCLPGMDTLTKAANLWYAKSKVPFSILVDCKKVIPVKAGLGGGSSDAASLLAVLQQIAGKNALDCEELQQVARQVGSDVPFFLSGFPSALVRGKGELVEKVKVPEKEVLLVMPTGFDISTSQAYKALDARRESVPLVERYSLSFLLSLLQKNCYTWNHMLYNDFSPCTGHTEFYDSLNRLACEYSGFYSLTGSGACWFFVSEQKDKLLQLQEKITLLFGSKVRMWLAPLMQ
ncbi:4-diphosphocytidyl-2C-methyl-D-erythritol 2-phosphate synthase [Sphaerochaeta pleomorpha str. Grapes]|uniref:4-diphosphocytidyl-2-C-methyl-D-erythritol kinase n=1 Tax=Sphaerochaeta pleomorpha (strain ATCC BAA-1885 / DSM 22778 / Grapes) TaxID=158190 RepID=G8QYB9_SPHPG|nr:4-diphosphocytidyl-2C-methyl-D-erythritol kinase [Sphaerochaeta pleomorpha]AEV30766.1 4-diphosphocytidyl-2C-methyl-D-erythritol 2-phosphate synthase [Sphaerochaeta pleomorpha str. Grapes]